MLNTAPSLQSLVCDYYGLHDQPFSIAPDPRFLFMSGQHNEALAHVRFGLQGEGGVVLLTGEVGTGKTTICRHFLASLKNLEEAQNPIDLAYILHPALSVSELLHSLCDELGIAIAPTSSIKIYMDALNHHLLASHARGRNTVVMIDEAQNLSVDVLEQLRLLTNLETNERKLLQILLVGQPELRDLLKRYELRQLNQRITARFHLNAMTAEETRDCIRHRLRVAGRDAPLFTAAAIREVHRHSAGIPRLINLICARALLGAYAGSQSRIGRRIIHQAAREVLDQEGRSSSARLYWLSGLLLLAVYGWYTGISPQTLLSPVTARPSLERAVQPPPPAAPPQIENKPEANIAVAENLTPPPSSTPTTLGGSEASALQTLAEVWQAGIQGNDCDSIARLSGLQCFRQSLSLAELRDFDRPALLTLVADDGQHYAAVLRHMDGATAQLLWQDQHWSMPLEELERRRFAETTLLWQATADYHGPIRNHDRNSMIERIREQLNTVEKVRQIGSYQAQDWNTAMQVRLQNFQRQQGLTPDGIAGALTLMRLNDAVHAPRPHLDVFSESP